MKTNTAVNPPNILEQIEGILFFEGEWKVKCGYGIFPLIKSLQNKPDKNNKGNFKVTATVRARIVMDYGFID